MDLIRTLIPPNLAFPPENANGQTFGVDLSFGFVLLETQQSFGLRRSGGINSLGSPVVRIDGLGSRLDRWLGKI
jgi:hypothetical protein